MTHDFTSLLAFSSTITPEDVRGAEIWALHKAEELRRLEEEQKKIELRIAFVKGGFSQIQLSKGSRAQRKPKVRLQPKSDILVGTDMAKPTRRLVRYRNMTEYHHLVMHPVDWELFRRT